MANSQKKRPPWRSFEEARAFVHDLGLKTKREWQAYCYSGRKPEDIPSVPEQSYRDHFLDYGDWLGIAHRWSKKRLLAFLTHLQQSLPLLTEKELSMIILQEDVAPQFHRLFGQRSPDHSEGTRFRGMFLRKPLRRASSRFLPEISYPEDARGTGHWGRPEAGGSVRRPCGRRIGGCRKKGQESYPRVRSLVKQCALRPIL